MIDKEYRLISRPFVNRWLIEDENGTKWWVDPLDVSGSDDTSAWVSPVAQLEPFETYNLPPIDFD